MRGRKQVSGTVAAEGQKAFTEVLEIFFFFFSKAKEANKVCDLTVEF